MPHDSTVVPNEVREQFLLDDAELERELIRMTDHLTQAIFEDPLSEAKIVRALVSRLVIDVERFPNDADEPMAARGMGASYTLTSQSTPLRRVLPTGERDALMRTYYRPHHVLLEAAVDDAIEIHGRCLVIDCHSFPSVALPYERADSSAVRPDICIGTDDFHTNDRLSDAFCSAFATPGWSVSLNEPFDGALVPGSRYRRDARVSAIMVEVNRGLYLRETDATPLPGFAHIARQVRQCCSIAIACGAAEGHEE